MKKTVIVLALVFIMAILVGLVGGASAAPLPKVDTCNIAACHGAIGFGTHAPINYPAGIISISGNAALNNNSPNLLP